MYDHEASRVMMSFGTELDRGVCVSKRPSKSASKWLHIEIIIIHTTKLERMHPFFASERNQFNFHSYFGQCLVL